MKTSLPKILVTVCCLLSTFSALQGQAHYRVLLIGNSYTASNNLAQLISNLALAGGDTLTIATSSPGGFTFNQHSTYAQTQTLIQQGNWDFVVLQEQSQLPSFPIQQVQADVFPYAALLNDQILTHSPCAETVFFMTWGRQNGDQQNCANLPQLCTFFGMNQLLRERYLIMGMDNEAIVSPVGAVWDFIRRTQPQLNLYTADGSHPSLTGSYLAACTFYATLLRRSPQGFNYYGGLSAADASLLQDAAAAVVLDSADQWYIGNYDLTASFNTSLMGNVADFTVDAPQPNVNYTWDFGDGDTATGSLTQHTYAQDGVYFVTLIANDGCQTYTTTQALQIVISGQSIVHGMGDFQVSPNPSKGEFRLKAQTANTATTSAVVYVYSPLGELLLSKQWSPEQDLLINLSDYPKGLYLLRLEQGKRRELLKLLRD